MSPWNWAPKIPVIDFTGLTSADLALRKDTAMSMREAFEDFGFIYLQNHSMPQSVIDELFARSIAFFDLPQATKAEARGYRGAGLSGLTRANPQTLRRDSEPPTIVIFRLAIGRNDCLIFVRQFRFFMERVSWYCAR
jgi:isopenicillin N synthase-like dioxygenase